MGLVAAMVLGLIAEKHLRDRRRVQNVVEYFELLILKVL